MKKILFTFLIIFPLVFLTACGGAAPRFDVRTELPWGDASHITETKTFRVEVFCALTPATSPTDRGLILAEGQLIQTITGCAGTTRGCDCSDDELTYVAAGRYAHFRVATRMNLTWGDHANAGVNRGLTDILSTDVTFSRASLLPITSRRYANLGTRPAYDGAPSFNNSQYVRTNFEVATEGDSGYRYISGVLVAPRTSETRIRRNADGTWSNNVQIQQLADVDMFCNEQLHYLIRGLSGIDLGTQMTLPTHNPIENYLRGTSAPTSVLAGGGMQIGHGRLSGFPALEEFISRDDLTQRSETRTREYPEGSGINVEYTYYFYTFDVTSATVALGGELSGPNHNFIMTAPNVTLYNDRIQTNRLILNYFYSVHNTYGTRIFDFAYTLIEYSVE